MTNLQTLAASNVDCFNPSRLAALVHRLSGLALALFLPLHFLTLAFALRGETFAKAIDWTNHPALKASEALLVMALAVHLAGGARLLAFEFLGLDRRQALIIAASFGFAFLFGLLFVLRVL